jgi:hypothetical protein
LISEKEYIDSEISEIAELHTQLVLDHKLCEGTGMSLEGNGVTDCVCVLIFKYLKELIYSNIPGGYWGISADSMLFYFDKVTEMKKFHNIQFKESCSIGSLQGDGKTAFLSMLGKQAIQKKHSVFFTTPEKILRIIRDEDILVERLQGSEIILVDNIERYNRSKWADGQIEYFLRNLKDKGKILYLSLSDIEIGLPDGLLSFLKNQIYNNFVISFKGKKKDLKVLDYFDKKFVAEIGPRFKEILEIK